MRQADAGAAVYGGWRGREGSLKTHPPGRPQVTLLCAQAGGPGLPFGERHQEAHRKDPPALKPGGPTGELVRQFAARPPQLTTHPPRHRRGAPSSRIKGNRESERGPEKPNCTHSRVEDTRGGERTAPIKLKIPGKPEAHSFLVQMGHSPN